MCRAQEISVHAFALLLVDMRNDAFDVFFEGDFILVGV